ncbi:MAG: ribonuclease P protein component [Rhodospirillaceae bacterium]|nr:ribonuclease P protein component [Rhodospirillales bacterium]
MPLALARLKKRPDFLRVAGLRRKWATPGLILQAAPVPDQGSGDANMTAGAPSVGFQRLEGGAAAGQRLEGGAAAGQRLDGNSVRIGFTCSKKVGNAVARNRAKRRLKAAVDEVFPGSARPGLDYVVIGRQETVARPYSLLLQDLRTALKRVGGLKSDE